jgi:hypothetical protein
MDDHEHTHYSFENECESISKQSTNIRKKEKLRHNLRFHLGAYSTANGVLSVLRYGTAELCLQHALLIAHLVGTGLQWTL